MREKLVPFIKRSDLHQTSRWQERDRVYPMQRFPRPAAYATTGAAADFFATVFFVAVFFTG